MTRFKVRWQRTEKKTEYIEANSPEEAQRRLINMRQRYGEEVKMLECISVSDEELLKRIVPVRADGWQLYTCKPKANLAAASLTRSLKASFQRLRKVSATELKAALQHEVNEFEKRRDRWSDCGAADTEPREVGYGAYEQFCTNILKISCRIEWGEVTLL